MNWRLWERIMLVFSLAMLMWEVYEIGRYQKLFNEQSRLIRIQSDRIQMLGNVCDQYRIAGEFYKDLLAKKGVQ